MGNNTALNVGISQINTLIVPNSKVIGWATIQLLLTQWFHFNILIIQIQKYKLAKKA